MESIYIYLTPYDRNHDDMGFYIYPFAYRTYGDYLDVLQEDHLEPALEKGVEEWEFADSEGINSYCTDAVGINKDNWELLKELFAFADDIGLSPMQIIEVSDHFGSATGASYLEEAYMGKYDSMLDYAYSIIDDQGGPVEEQAENYFNFDAFGNELKVDFLYSYYLEDWEDRFDSEEEAEQAYEDKYDERDSDVAEWFIYDVIGDLQSAVGDNMTNYFDYKKFARDLEYEYTEIEGCIWWSH